MNPNTCCSHVAAVALTSRSLEVADGGHVAEEAAGPAGHGGLRGWWWWWGGPGAAQQLGECGPGLIAATTAAAEGTGQEGFQHTVQPSQKITQVGSLKKSVLRIRIQI